MLKVTITHVLRLHANIASFFTLMSFYEHVAQNSSIGQSINLFAHMPS